MVFICLWPNAVDIPKLIQVDQIVKIWNIRGLHHQVTIVKGIDNVLSSIRYNWMNNISSFVLKISLRILSGVQTYLLWTPLFAQKGTLAMLED